MEISITVGKTTYKIEELEVSKDVIRNAIRKIRLVVRDDFHDGYEIIVKLVADSPSELIIRRTDSPESESKRIMYYEFNLLEKALEITKKILERESGKR